MNLGLAQIQEFNITFTEYFLEFIITENDVRIIHVKVKNSLMLRCSDE